MVARRSSVWSLRNSLAGKHLCAGLFLLVAILSGPPPASAGEDSAAEQPFQRRGFYLHAAWKYNYPFAVRSWKRADYQNMFQLLRQLGFNTVMMWPVLEAIPAPLSQADQEALRAFRPIIEDAQKSGLEAWLALGVVTSRPEIAAKPWPERSLYAHMQTVRLDLPQEAESYLQHRASLLKILNNADGYVTIDGDPGGYPGAKPSEFLQVLLSDRATIDRFGTHPNRQKIVPWIWRGWGTDESKGCWGAPIEPGVRATLAALKQQMPEPWELLPGRSHEKHANKRINMELVQEAGLLNRSTLFLYEAIEYEPIPPAAILQLADIRDYMQRERSLLAEARGCFGNAQQPIMVLPNLYFFARCARDPTYVDQPDERVLTDLAEFLGGPPELLIPAWSCLRLSLEDMPTDLPARLRATKLTAPGALFLPGGAACYLNVLASQVDSQIHLLQAVARPAETPREAAAVIADGTAALVDWWKLHRYVGGGEGDEPFDWTFSQQYPVLKAWCAKHVTAPQPVLELAVNEIVRRGVLTEPVARDRVAELLKGGHH